MERADYTIILDDLKTSLKKRDFKNAVKIADSVDVRKTNDIKLLIYMADAYEITKNYKQAKGVLVRAYNKAENKRQLSYKLCRLSIKMKNYEEAEYYLDIFEDIAPRDANKYILKYLLAKAKGERDEKLIEILEDYKNLDMEEKWAYELARLYANVGNEKKCVDLCDDISLWFPQGKYINKVMDLKKEFQPLSSTQQENYNAKKEDEEDVIKEKVKEKHSQLDIEALMANLPKLGFGKKKEKADDIKDSLDSDLEEVKPVKETPKTKEVEDTSATQRIEINLKEIEREREGQADIPVRKLKPFEINPGGLSSFLNNKPAENDTEFKPEFDQDIVEIKPEKENKTEDQPTKDLTVNEIFSKDNVEKEDKFDVEEITTENKELELSDFEVKETEKKEEVKEPSKDNGASTSSVEDILRQLQERGILKADTVEGAVNTIKKDREKIVLSESEKNAYNEVEEESSKDPTEETSAKTTEVTEEQTSAEVTKESEEQTSTEAQEMVAETSEDASEKITEEPTVEDVEEVNKPEEVSSDIEDLEDTEDTEDTDGSETVAYKDIDEVQNTEDAKEVVATDEVVEDNLFAARQEKVSELEDMVEEHILGDIDSELADKYKNNLGDTAAIDFTSRKQSLDKTTDLGHIRAQLGGETTDITSVNMAVKTGMVADIEEGMKNVEGNANKFDATMDLKTVAENIKKMDEKSQDLGETKIVATEDLEQTKVVSAGSDDLNSTKIATNGFLSGKQVSGTIKYDDSVVLDENDMGNTGEIPKLAVPTFDLSAKAPNRDDSNDLGKEGLYEELVSNSDLKDSTDKLPSQKEIDEAISKAVNQAKGKEHK